ncbi:DUF1659 domain-containing protein [Alkalihalobacillus sp. CinArs1]|uniref:DUF1659 domain-containing protein n=1 Tax=Alkalihalobacillus sp. CinArs1 TaxID=2995314 RepID=UPI0022DD77D0|nr:DUF1659 domain-containing protein [Alkalihalobacillus sp. CinArs1]
MATASLNSTQLRMVLDVGVDEKGKTIFRSKNFNNIKVTASTDALFTVAAALAPLQQHTMFAVERNDSSDLLG